ncbi:MAG TPA: IS256 family transposase [Thermoanaerobaculia bacterium]|jgi:putative transposase|nr:IS256 family transposase [Thermoanaerobaculia bacterium]
MPRKKIVVSSGPAIPSELLDLLVPGPLSAEGVGEVMSRFKKALMERVLCGELSPHLGYSPGEAKPESRSNHRNGSSGKTVLTDTGAVRIEVPRDREGTFEPLLIGKHERRFQGFDDKILALYARGMTVREIQGYLREMYTVEVSPDLISSVTDAVMSEVTGWQSRPLEGMYPVVMFDALRVKIRDEGVVRSRADLALGVLADGSKDILGIWIEATEGAKFWMKVFNDLKTRGCHDILIAVTDGLSGLGEALAVVYPSTTLQTCIVHLIRNSLSYASWKDRRALAAALKPPIYTAVSAEAAEAELEAFAQGSWGKRFPTVAPSWRRAWDKVIPFFAFPPEVRRVLYTTNAIESVNARLRKIIKTRGHFPSDAAATKLIWLALRNITTTWSKPDIHWKAAMNQFAILYDERFTRAAAAG